MKKSIMLLAVSLAACVAQGELVAHFNFEEGSGTTAIDSSGNAYDGVIANGATWVAGTSGSALRLDGVDDYVTLNASTFVGMSNAVSISAMVWGGPTNPERSTFFFGSGNADGSGRQMQIHLPWENGVAYWRAPGGQISYTPTATETAGTWNHWVFTKNAAGENQIVLNNVVVASGTGDTGLFDVVTARLGGDPTDDPARAFDGAIDDFRVYDHELTAGEIATLYAAIPEPGTLSLLGIFGGAVLFFRRRSSL